MTRTAILVLLVLCLCSISARADLRTIPLGADRSALTLTEQRDDLLSYEVRVGDIQALDVETPEGTFTRLLLPEFHTSHQEGAPELPMMNRLFEIPYQANAQVEVVSQTSRTLRLADFGITHPLFPSQPSMPKNADPATWPFVYDQGAYAAARVAQPAAAVVDLGTLRAMRLGRLEISPVEYLPGSGEIVVHDQMVVRIHFQGGDRQAEVQRKLSTYSPFFEGLYQRMDGYRGQHDLHPDLVRDVVTMVIVTPAQYEAQLQTFVNWKRTRGFKVVVGVIGTPEVGTTTTSIQAWLRNLYNNGTPQQPSPSFVLFVGDVDVMPTWLMSGDCTDRPYCAVDADLMPEMYYGRFSCSNPTNLQAMIDKTLMYDQFTMPDPSYLGNVVMIAGVDGSFGRIWANGQINYGTTYYFNATHGIFSYTHLYPESGSQDAQIVAEVSAGVGYVNYTAHGSEGGWADPTFTQANINSLQNNGKYCLAVGNCCLTSHYDYGSECFAETFLRAANKGAIGYIGGANNTLWDEDYYWGVGYRAAIVEHPTFDAAHMGAYDGVFHDHSEPMTKWYVTNDALVFCGDLAVTESGSGNTTYYWNIYNLMGDPSLSCYLGVPPANPVTYPSSILISWNSISITAAPNSYVGLTRNGELIGAGTTNATGNLELPIWNGPLTPGTAHLCVTAQNRIPFQVDIPVVAPSGPYVLHEATSILDEISGDGDGACDAGETVDFSLTLENVGVETATGVTAVISSSDPYAEILAATESYPDLPPGGSGTSTGHYCVAISPAAPDDHAVEFTLSIQSAQGSWQDTFVLTVGRPSLAYAAMVVDDGPPLGNGSGWLVPDEGAEIVLSVANGGHAGANNAVLTITASDPHIQVVNGTASCAEIPALGQGTFTPLVLRVAPDCPVPAVLAIEVTATADFAYSTTFSIALSVGGFADDAESDRGWTCGAAGDNASSGLWVREDPVGTIYNSQVAQPEDDHTAAPGVVCFVTGNGVPGGAAGAADVDGGKTTLLTPVFDLDGVEGATIHYYLWYTNSLGNSPNSDYWDVDVTSDGTNWVSLEHTMASTNAWVERSFDLGDYVTLSSAVRVRFVAQDTGSNSLVEALIDDFVLTVQEPATAALPAAETSALWQLGPITPNPASGRMEIRFLAPRSERLAIRIYDVTGALVRTLFEGTAQAGLRQLVWDRMNDAGRPAAAGVYFLKMQAAGFTKTAPLVLIR